MTPNTINRYCNSHFNFTDFSFVKKNCKINVQTPQKINLIEILLYACGRQTSGGRLNAEGEWSIIGKILLTFFMDGHDGFTEKHFRESISLELYRAKNIMVSPKRFHCALRLTQYVWVHVAKTVYHFTSQYTIHTMYIFPHMQNVICTCKCHSFDWNLKLFTGHTN